MWARLELGQPRYEITLFNLNTPLVPWQLLGGFGCLPGYFGACYRPHINELDHIEFRARNIWGTDGFLVQILPGGQALGYSAWDRSEINDLDQLAIEAHPLPAPAAGEPKPSDILFWDGAAMRVVYRSPVWTLRPHLNNAGVIAFEGFGGLPGSISGGDDQEIFVYDPDLGSVIQLTDDDDAEDSWAAVTADGRIVWTGRGGYPGSTSYAGDQEIFMAVPTGDADGDGVDDPLDNCPLEPNPSQDDAGGIGPGSLPDGVGDACQCGDVDGSLRVEQPDVDLLRLDLAGAGPPPLPERCSVAGFDGPNASDCDMLDVVVLRRALQQLGPGLLQLCGPAHAWQ